MKIGYARISTPTQSLDRQIERLKEYGCEIIYSEQTSGYRKDRVEFNKMIESVRPGDTIVVTTLDRFGRNTVEALKTAEEIAEKGVGIYAIQQRLEYNADSSATNKLLFHVFTAVCEMERNFTSEKIRDSMKLAKAKGIKLGRKFSLDKERAKFVVESYYMNKATKNYTVKELAQRLGVPTSTLHRYIQWDREEKAQKKQITGQQSLFAA